MLLKQQRKIIFAITIFYTLFILYFLFFAFGRVGKADQISEYTFMFVPDSFFRVPSLSSLLQPTLMSLVGFGNIAAFIPFGILIPMLYRTSFVRFITLFILSILFLETIQALTFLGSFDINDVIENSLGAAIGLGAYKLSFRTNNNWRNFAAASISSVVILLGVWGILGVIDQAFTKETGPFVAINELKDSNGNPTVWTKPNSLTIGGQSVEPQYNVYSIEGKNKETYTYALGDKKELYLSLNYGIPDSKELQGSIRVTVDEHEFLVAENQGHEMNMSEIFIPRANELTITIEGNVTLWDVGFREMVYFWESASREAHASEESFVRSGVQE